MRKHVLPTEDILDLIYLPNLTFPVKAASLVLSDVPQVAGAEERNIVVLLGAVDEGL